MSYVYDLFLNFNSDLYEFYEWRKDDNVCHIKRINLIKIDSKTYNDILDYNVVLSDDLIVSLYNKCEYYNNRMVITIPYALLITDSYRVMGLMLNNEGKIVKYSSFLLDEEEYVLDSDLGIGKARICDFIGGFRIDDYEEGGTHLYTIKTAFKHKDLDMQYDILFTITHNS